MSLRVNIEDFVKLRVRASLFEGLYHGILVEDFPTLMSFNPIGHHLTIYSLAKKHIGINCTKHLEVVWHCCLNNNFQYLNNNNTSDMYFYNI